MRQHKSSFIAAFLCFAAVASASPNATVNSIFKCDYTSLFATEAKSDMMRIDRAIRPYAEIRVRD